MSVYKPKGATLYKYDFQRSGQRFSGSTREAGQRAAEAVERRLIAEVEDSLKAGRRVGLRGMTMDAAADRYWTETAQHTASPEKLGPEMKRLVLMVGPRRLIADISDEVVAGLVAKRRQEFVKGDPKRGLVSPAQVNRTVTQLLRRILTRAKLVWKVTLPHEPHWRAHMLKEPTARVRELRHDEEAKLEAVEREDYRASRVFAQLTGLRRREVANLTWHQVDFANGTISVVGKGDKPHVLPITDELYELLAPLQGHHPEAVFTFVAQRSRRCPKSKASYLRGQRYPVTYEGLGTQFGRAAKGAGLKGLRLHDLRHTAATRTLRATGNLRLVQQMLAHSSPTTTAKYAHASLDDMREGMAKAASDSSRRRAAMAGTEVRPVMVTPMQAVIAEHHRLLIAIEASPPFDCDCEELVALDRAEQDALEAIVATPCSGRADALAVLRHFQPYVAAQGSAFGKLLYDMGDITCTVAETILRALAVALDEPAAQLSLAAPIAKLDARQHIFCASIDPAAHHSQG
ncbi:tyrosine-type recombinase/integrase [Methylobacterium sp. Leaf113]|uniref:tyrosine-type recombinase/integrase n=1 Tax=Methylobacterium sp. Leaf113 TaxID=1736259 RepID=UPI000AA9F725|nr:site-specific integrase [Methylobacterium sp. Leaf113]